MLKRKFHKIEVKPAAIPEQASGLQDAFADMASALRVVEGGDRAVPSQAIAVYNESAQQRQSSDRRMERVQDNETSPAESEIV